MPHTPEPVRPIRIAVAGAGVAQPDVEQIAEALGSVIAENGAVLICGGLTGVMEAAARGAAQRGGITVGLLPGADATSANRYITIPLPTGLGEARNALVARCGDALIAIGGEWGTLSEISLAMKTGVPVILLRPPLGVDLGLPVAGSPEEAVAMALQKVRGA